MPVLAPLLVALLGLAAAPEEPQSSPSPSPSPSPPAERAPASEPPKIAVSAYVEAFYGYNFNRPSNGITNFRGFDNRHDSITLANAVLDTSWSAGRVSGRLALQVGHTPNSYYLAEPVQAGTAGAGASGPSEWKLLQQALVGWNAPVGRGLKAEAGLFLSPIGPESIQAKDSWNWSRSNLFFGLPFYHTGLRVSYPLDDRWTLMGLVCNGWNSVVDNNDRKSVTLQVTRNVPDKLFLSALYFGGVERATHAPEGQPWRSLLDSYGSWTVTPSLSLGWQLDAGFESSRFGTSSWRAGAFTLRLALNRWLWAAARGDVLEESLAENALGASSPIFFPARRVSSATLTLEARPESNLSLRLEYRHDGASAPIYFKDAGEVPTAKSQQTLAFAFLAWF